MPMKQNIVDMLVRGLLPGKVRDAMPCHAMPNAMRCTGASAVWCFATIENQNTKKEKAIRK